MKEQAASGIENKVKRMNRPKPSASLSDQAYIQLKWLILNQEIPQGTLLNELALVDSTGFGRAPIHHALHRLAYDDLVEILPRKGAQVRIWSDRDLDE